MSAYSSNSAPTESSILDALRGVQDPDLKQDLVTLNMIKDLKVSPEGAVSLRVVLTTPACPMKAKIEADVKQAVQSVAGVTAVQVQMDAQVRNSVQGRGGQQIKGVQHIIAVSSGKGGVGKSTVAVNLACALAKEGARVGIMDADIYGPNVPTMMGVTEAPKLIKDPVKGEIFYPPTAQGIKVMSMGFLIQGDQPAVWRGPMLHSIISQFCHQVEWGELDYLIVDMPPGTGDVQLSLAQLVPVTGTVMVTTPQEVAMQDVRKAFHMFEKVRIPVLGLVENMSFFRCGGCSEQHFLFGSKGGQALAKKFKVDLLEEIPIVPTVCQGGDEGFPIVMREPDSEVAQAFRSLARKVAQKASILAAENAGPTQFVQIGRFN